MLSRIPLQSDRDFSGKHIKMAALHPVFSILSSPSKQEREIASVPLSTVSHSLPKSGSDFEQQSSVDSIPKNEDVKLSPQTAASLSTTTRDAAPTVDSLPRLLARAAASDAGIVTYAPGADIDKATRTSYRSLFETAKDKARLLHEIDGISPSSIILIHFDNHTDNITWFWAVTLAGYLPAISTPLANDTTQRKRHLSHLHVLLKNPIVLTSTVLVPDFLDGCKLRLRPVESLVSTTVSPVHAVPEFDSKRAEDLAVLMLTSGSTGNAKAVGLRHGQILTSISGKSEHHGVGKDDTFLNWIGM